MIRFLIMIALSTLVTASALADRRKYAFTYQSTVVPEDDVELEFYQTTKLNDTDSWEYRFEVEHGLAPQWDMAVYQIFSQREGESLKWDAFQLRTRFKIDPAGRMPFDPALYLEYNRKVDLKKKNKLEAKLLLSEDFNRLNVSINPLYEFFWAPGDPVHEFGLDLGMSWEFSYRFSLGFETVNRYEMLEGEDDEQSSYLGPALSFTTGSIFYTVSYLAGLTDDSDDARVRFLMGVGL